MQYKIPVQVEQADVIFLGLSLKQLIILLIYGSIAYSIFKGLEPTAGGLIALLPAIIIFMFGLAVVLFKHSEMTFVPFILNLIRVNINGDPKTWQNGVDSFMPIDIGYVIKIVEIKKDKVDLGLKRTKLEFIEDKINKL